MNNQEQTNHYNIVTPLWFTVVTVMICLLFAGLGFWKALLWEVITIIAAFIGLGISYDSKALEIVEKRSRLDYLKEELEELRPKVEKIRKRQRGAINQEKEKQSRHLLEINELEKTKEKLEMDIQNFASGRMTNALQHKINTFFVSDEPEAIGQLDEQLAGILKPKIRVKYPAIWYQMIKDVLGNAPLSQLVNDREEDDSIPVGEMKLEPLMTIEQFRESIRQHPGFASLLDNTLYRYGHKIETIQEMLLKAGEELEGVKFEQALNRIRQKKITEVVEKQLEYRRSFENNYPYPIYNDDYEKAPSQAELRRREKERQKIDDQIWVSVQGRIQSYQEELFSTFYPKDFFLRGFKAIVPYKARQRHCYILGSSGSGKTELLKQFIYHDIHYKRGVLVLDPHGDMVQDCNRFKERGAETIYLSAEQSSKGLLPRYNPLSHNYHDKPEEEKEIYISVRAEQLKDAFAKIITGEFTVNMQTLISYCLRVLLRRKGSTFHDFLNFMRPQTCLPYLELGKNYPDPQVKEFFLYDFEGENLIQSKKALVSRFGGLLSNYNLGRILLAKESSFQLTKLLDEGKCVLVNLNQNHFGEKGAHILGAFLLSEIATYALSREKTPVSLRTPVFVYVDESQNFISERISKLLSEARKYGIHMTLSNQYLDQFKNSNGLQSSIFANTAVKICSTDNPSDRTKMAKSMGIHESAIPAHQPGKFAMKVGKYAPVIFQGYDFLLRKGNHGNSVYMSKLEYEKKLPQQLKKYYRYEDKEVQAFPDGQEKFDDNLIKTML